MKFILSLLLVSFIHAQQTASAMTKRAAPTIRPPSIIEQNPKKTYVFYAGQSVELVCIANGEPDPNYKWMHNGDEFIMGPNVEKGTHGTITIKETTSSAKGQYQCIAANQWGKALSNIFQLEFASLVPFPPDATDNQYSKKEGQPLTISCNSPTGRAKSIPEGSAIYTWLMVEDKEAKGTPVVLGSRVSQDTKGDLYFAYVTEEDATQGRLYSCTVKNRFSQLSASGAFSTLIVDKSPNAPNTIPAIAFSTPSPYTALVKKPMELRCLFSSKPASEVLWSRSGGLPEEVKITQFGQQLSKASVEESDAGTYECVGRNSQGKSSVVTIYVNVEAEPEFVNKPADTTATVGTSVSFLCKTFAIPTADIIWYRNGERLDMNNPGPRRELSADRTNLTISDLNKPADLCNYQCKATNKWGYSFASGFLNVVDATKIFERPENKKLSLNQTDVLFKCAARGDPSTPVSIQWRRDDKKHEIEYVPGVIEKQGDNLYISFKNMDEKEKLGYQGKYTCYSTNGISVDTATATLSFDTGGGNTGGVVAAGSNNIIIIIVVVLVIVIALIIIILCCCMWCQRNRGDDYPVDKNERDQGMDPEKELADSGFSDYMRPEEGGPVKGSRASLNESLKMDSDDEASLAEYGDIDTGKFNEDGSFIGQYATNERKKIKRDPGPPPYNSVPPFSL